MKEYNFEYKVIVTIEIPDGIEPVFSENAQGCERPNERAIEPEVRSKIQGRLYELSSPGGCSIKSINVFSN
tara:strand:- start:391 stop:603 length:213 start_codon:yes stop_codon:yes gene_type:complete